MLYLVLTLALAFGGSALAAKAKESLVLRVGMIKKVPCRGRLQVSAVGDDRKVLLEALPKHLGCAVLLKPAKPGRTNLILETSAESLARTLLILPAEKVQPSKSSDSPETKAQVKK